MTLARTGLLAACTACAGAGALAAAPAAETSFLVRYRSASTVYLEGGRAQGLAPGDRLFIRGAPGTAAQIEVVFVAEQSASCRVVSEVRAVVAGDVAVLAPRPAPAASPPAAAVPSVAPPAVAAPPRVTPAAPAPPLPVPVVAGTAPSRRAVPLARYRGGVSLGYYRVRDGEGTTGTDQRSANADLRAWDIGGQPLSLGARFRLRRDTRLAGPPSANLRDDRIYELSLRYQERSGAFDVEAGRIGASGWASIGTLDGVLGEVRVLSSPLHLGGFYGRRVDLGRPGAPASATRYGALLRLAPPRGGPYEVLLGGVRESEGGAPSREYLSLETRINAGRRWSFYERAELDINRGWRRDLARRPFQLSNVWLSTTVRLGDAHSVVLSYDNRRNFRDLSNRSIPETIFDASLRQGARASVYLGHPRGFNVALNGSGRLGDGGGQSAWSYGGALRHGNLFGLGVMAAVDGSVFVNGSSDGWMATAQAGRMFGAGHHLDVSYGLSRYRPREGGQERQTQWLRGSARVELVGGLYILGDVELGSGDDFRGLRVMAETGYRF